MSVRVGLFRSSQENASEIESSLPSYLGHEAGYLSGEIRLHGCCAQSKPTLQGQDPAALRHPARSRDVQFFRDRALEWQSLTQEPERAAGPRFGAAGLLARHDRPNTLTRVIDIHN